MIHRHVDIVPRELSAKRDCGRVITGIRAQVGRGGGDVKRAGAFALHFVVFQSRTICEHNLNYRIRKVRRLGGADIALNQSGAAVLFGDNQQARERYLVCVA